MEKVKVTKEQAEAIEKYANSNKKELCIENWVKGHFHTNKVLSELSLEELAKALYIGYEVEPEFKVGDWVYNEKAGTVARVGERYDGGEWVWVDDEEFTFYSVNDTRHATPEEIEKEKERRWWAEHGRDVWELKTKDMLVHRETGSLFEVFMVTDGYVRLNGVPSRTFEEVKNYYKVAFFAEDRKDVGDND